MVEIRQSTPPSVQMGHSQQRGSGVAVAQSLHGRVPDIYRVLNGLIPVRVLVPDCRVNLVQVVHVTVAYERPQDPVPVVLLEPVLYLGRAEVVVALCRGHAQHQIRSYETVTGHFHGVDGVR